VLSAASLRFKDGSRLLSTIEAKYTDSFGSTKLDLDLLTKPIG
jgi:hypothetical protein